MNQTSQQPSLKEKHSTYLPVSLCLLPFQQSQLPSPRPPSLARKG